MKSSILIILVLFVFKSHSQKDSLSILHTNIWTPKKSFLDSKHWSKSDTIYLQSEKYHLFIGDSLLKKPNLSTKEFHKLYKVIKPNKETIKFDSLQNVIHYPYDVTCPVGVRFHIIKKIKLRRDKVNITYSEYQWSQRDKEKRYSINYKIILWNENEIILSKIKE